MKQDCTTCKYAEFLKTKSGRRRLDYGGDCTLEVDFPLSYTDSYMDAPIKKRISKYTCRNKECPCWEKLK